MNDYKKNIIIATGGTGGHIFPAVSLTDYLNKNLNYRNINFVRSGGSDSNSSDIYVFHENKKILTIECKLSPSQSSQFVVLIDSEKNRFTGDGQSSIHDPSSTVALSS